MDTFKKKMGGKDFQYYFLLHLNEKIQIWNDGRMEKILFSFLFTKDLKEQTMRNRKEVKESIPDDCR